MQKNLTSRNLDMKAIRRASKWMRDAEKMLETPGMGIPDACDSARMAMNELEKANILSSKTRKCILLLTKTIDDILPQMGKICLQDYAALNDGLILSRELIGKEK